VSPIYTRPIREQLEHDRVIRELQARYKRKHEVAINPGAEQNQSVMVGEQVFYPDLVLLNGRRIEGTVEVETAESVHPLEARAEWGVLSRLKVPFHLYIPPQMADAARRICADQQYDVAEIWTYYTGPDQQVRFTQIYKSAGSPRGSAATKVPSKPAPPQTARPAAEKPRGSDKVVPAPRTAAEAAVSSKAVSPGKPAAAAKAVKARPAKIVAKAAKTAKASKPVKPAKPVQPTKAAKAAPRVAGAVKASRPAAKTASGRAPAKVPRSRR
jgi:hypothetical protein